MNRRRFKPFGLALVAVAALAVWSAAWADRGGLGPRQIHGTGFRHGQVQAHGHGHRHLHGGTRIGIGIQWGPGFLYPAYPYYSYYPYYPYYPYYYPYHLGYYSGYYYGPSFVVPSSPPQYIERGDDMQDGEGGAPVPAQPSYWYHCARPEGYYPYVTTCPGGWQLVPAQPPATAR